MRKSGTKNRNCGYKVDKTVVKARLCSCLRYERRVLKSNVGAHSEQSTQGIACWRRSKNNHTRTVKWGYEYSERIVENVFSVCVCVCLYSLLHSAGRALRILTSSPPPSVPSWQTRCLRGNISAFVASHEVFPLPSHIFSCIFIPFQHSPSVCWLYG